MTSRDASGAPGVKKSKQAGSHRPDKKKEEVPMKKRALVMTSFLLLSLIAVAPAVRAQQPLAVNVPFEFTVGNATLPAGDYRVQKVAEDSPVLLIRGQEAGASAMVMTTAAQENGQPSLAKLVFSCYGNRCFLSQIWTPGSSNVRQLIKSAREKELVQIAGIESKREVTLVARLLPARP
jgi:hypothetical protein